MYLTNAAAEPNMTMRDRPVYEVVDCEAAIDAGVRMLYQFRYDDPEEDAESFLRRMLCSMATEGCESRAQVA